MKKVYTLIIVLLFIISIGNAQSGITWSPAMQVATSGSGNYHPRINLDASDSPLLIWGHSNRAMFSKWNGTTFTAPIMLNTAQISIACDTWFGPDIASKGDTVYVVMKRYPEAPDTNRIFIVRSFNGGATFSAPIELAFIADSTSRFPTVTIDNTYNPIVGYMKFANSMNGSTSRWVVTKSSDYGNTFATDVRASGWSGGPVCDCCPGTITNSGNKVLMLYRDVNVNIRDMWAGVSNDNGATFTNGYETDGTNWLLTSCPASGPDGVIVGDSLYTVFMSGASGMSRVYYNKSSITNMNSVASTLITGNISGLAVQNFAHIASKGNAVAAVWKQSVNGADQLGLRFTNNIVNGFPALYDTVDLNNITNADVAIGNGVIYVTWEDDNAGVVMIRKGTFTPYTVGMMENDRNPHFEIYPNPANDEATLFYTANKSGASIIRMTDITGREVFNTSIMSEIGQNNYNLNLKGFAKGIYAITLQNGDTIFTTKIVVQ